MKKFYSIKLLMLVCLLLSFGLLVSCDNDNDEPANGGDIQLLSFGPTGAQHGEDIRFVGRNLTKVDAIDLPGATVPKSAFKTHTADLIVLTVPAEATEGYVTLKSANGEVTSQTILSFEVPIAITKIDTEAKPGTNLTIDGEKLNWVQGVLFGEDTVKTFVSQSASQLVLQVPMTAKTGTIVLLGGGTAPAFVETEEELMITLPQPSTIAPIPVYNGADLTVTGTDLDLVKEIIFAGVGTAKATSFVSQSATELVVKVPANASKGVAKLVAFSGVEVPTTQEVVTVLPAVTGLAPASLKHTEDLTITGTDLDLVKEVKFTGVGEAKVSTFVSQSKTQLVVKVPANASKGKLKLVAKSGVEVETTQEVTIILPSISSVSPSPVDPGQQLTITGTNLDLVKSIEFKGGAITSTFVSKSATQIVVVIPMTATRGALKLTTINDYVVETDAQAVIILPIVKTVTPEPVVVGQFLTLTGTDLNLVKTVIFEGGASTSTFAAQNASQLVLAVPATAKTGNLKLVTHSNFEVATGKKASIGTAEPNITTYIYNDALSTTWDLWGGWGKTAEDMASTEQVSRGAKAIKLSFNDAYGAFQLHPQKANALAGSTHIVLYIYGTVNSRASIQLKNSGGSTGADAPFDIKAGEWTLVEVPISSLGDISGGVSEFYIKNYGTNPNTFYIDDIGLR